MALKSATVLLSSMAKVLSRTAAITLLIPHFFHYSRHIFHKNLNLHKEEGQWDRQWF